MRGAKHTELENVVAVIGQGVREYVAILDEEHLSVSHPLGGQREAESAALRIVRGTEEPQLRLRLSEVRSVACRLDRVVVATNSQTIVLPMFGAAGVLTSKRRSVVAGTLGGQPREAFAARLADVAGLTAIAPGHWTESAAQSSPVVHDPASEVRVRSQLQSFGRAAVGMGFPALIAYRSATDEAFVDASSPWAWVLGILSCAFLAYGVRSLFLSVDATTSSVVVRNVGSTRTIPVENIVALAVAHHDSVRSLVAGRPMIAFRLVDGTVVAAQASICVTHGDAVRLASKAESIATLLGVANEVGLGALTNDRCGDDGSSVERAGRPFSR